MSPFLSISQLPLTDGTTAGRVPDPDPDPDPPLSDTSPFELLTLPLVELR